jgi:hypothetical protein
MLQYFHVLLCMKCITKLLTWRPCIHLQRPTMREASIQEAWRHASLLNVSGLLLTTQHYIPKGNNLDSHCKANHKSSLLSAFQRYSLGWGIGTVKERLTFTGSIYHLFDMILSTVAHLMAMPLIPPVSVPTISSCCFCISHSVSYSNN